MRLPSPHFRIPGRAAAAALALLAGPLLGGCSNNPYPKGETAQPVIYRYLTGDLRTLDPTKSYRVDEAYVTDLVYSMYYRYHYLKRDPYELELVLGAEHPRREPYLYRDRKTGKQVKGESWTFKIKPGQRYQDDPCFPGGKGREIVAADFLLSLRRLADPAIGCPILGFVEDKIIGLKEYAALCRQRKDAGQKPDYQAEVPGLRLDPKDPYTFRILLNQPYPQLRYLMAMHFTTPLAHEAVSKYGEDLKDHPVGSGPYILSEYRKKQQIVLTVNPNRNPEFYPTEGMPGDREEGLLEDAGKQLPLAEKIVFRFIPERITSWNLFLQGYLDRYVVTQDNFRQVMAPQGGLSEEMRRRGIKPQKAASPNVYYFGFNMNDPVWGGYTDRQRKMRQAVSLAIDAEAFIELLYAGQGKPAQWIIPPGIAGYDPEYRNPYRQHNVARAKQLLAEAGYPNGIDPKTGERLTLYYDNAADTPEDRQALGLTTKQIEAIGIKLESRTWRDVVWQERLDKGQAQFFTYGWFADYPDAENFVFMLYGPNKSPGPNHTDYHNPEYDRLFEQVRVMDDGPEREAIIRRMREISVEDCPWIYTIHNEQLGIDYGWLKNGKPHGVANDLAKYWRVDGAQRAALQAEWNRPNYWPVVILAAVFTLGSVPAVRVIRGRRRRKVRVENGKFR
jgi:ABC-type transport system substrate-binding protein